MNSLEKLGDEIRRWREAAGLSQQQLATKAGIATRTLSRIERGQVDAHTVTIGAIYRVLEENQKHVKGG
jgi:predicted transcriptional regulator